MHGYARAPQLSRGVMRIHFVRDKGKAMKTRICWLMMCAFLLAFGPAFSDDDAWNRLQKAKTIRCVFDLGTQAEWKGGVLKLSPQPVHFGEGGTVTFDSIKLRKHTAGPCELPLSAVALGGARLIGNGGAGDVFATLTTGSLSFVEETMVG